MSNLFPTVEDEQRMLKARARIVCRRWAHVRVALLPLFDARPSLREFDDAMFSLGEVAFADQEEEVLRE